jgi:hypothetical protein
MSLISFKNKRGSSLQRFKETEKEHVLDECFQRRSFNKNLKTPFYEHRSSNEPKETSTNLLMNEVLKENIKRTIQHESGSHSRK